MKVLESETIVHIRPRELNVIIGFVSYGILIEREQSRVVEYA